ncbi:response regulator [Marinomonas sp. C1424]|uniref:Response regulator n=2 Tax=Marinomonas transparens TaxID=2795388 RepID=A0A934JKC5_9GAMM|nr:response regulator [Marinomonas transparens]
MDEKSDAQHTTNSSEKRVLIIDDLGEMRLMLKSLMMSKGYTNIDVESSGQNAIKLILAKHYDIVLSDYNLGGSIDGQQILETTCKTYALDHSTIFIMITADTDYQSVVSVLEYQPDSYLVKPFTPAAFFRRLDRVEKQKKVFNEVNISRKKQNFVAMEKQATDIMTKFPHYASLCLKIIGESLFSRHQYEEAKEHYELAIQKNENLAWAYFGIAECELKLRNPELAIVNLEKTIELSRHFLSAYDVLADAQEKLKNPKAAQEAIMAALGVSPRSIDRTQRLGQISLKIKEWNVAEQAYAKIIRLTKGTYQEKVDYYYDHLKCLAGMMEHGEQSSKIAEKFKRSLIRLRNLGKENPVVISNSFRVEVQQYLSRELIGEAIKSWKHWRHLIDIGQASPITEAQEATLKKRLGVV